MVVIGRAMPVLSEDTKDPDAAMKKPFGRMLEALDDLKPNEVYVNTGSSPRNALWGGLMTAVNCFMPNMPRLEIENPPPS